jgi:hypothetical protein
MNKPFFRLTGDTRNLEQQLQTIGENRLLAEAFPALTFATGSNSVGVFGAQNNIDMMDEKSDWWSAAPGDDQRWLHGDIKDVSYTFTRKVYEKFVEIGNLNQ